jgi:preprotein translocase subunit YajC
MGSVFVYDFLGISAGMFVFILVLFAIVSFYFTARIQRKANRSDINNEK